jgi:Domain of unknown function (DUF4872)/Butirosin biosynthesis protein H, N-terminal
MTILKNYHHFDGLAWATGYLTNVLAFQGVTAPHTGKPYSEAMLMGINGGLSAGYFTFEYEGYEPHLHFLTRYPFTEEPGAVYERLGIAMTVRNTTDPEKAVANVLNALANDQPAIVWLDMASLKYNIGMTTTFADPDDPKVWLSMPLVVYGYDSAAGTVQLADRARVGLEVSAADFAAARARISKTKHKMMTIDAPNPDKLPSAIKAGIQACLDIFTGKPPVGGPSHVSSFGLEGYKKWAHLLTDTKNKKSWAKEFAPGVKMFNGLTTGYQTLEVYYTGGCGARGVYADFLDEAAVVLDKAALREVATTYRKAAERWGELTAAMLPDHVAPFKQARELMRRNYDLFLAHGTASQGERLAISHELQAVKEQMRTEFPMSEAEAAKLRTELAERVMAIHDVEAAAIAALQAAVS